MAKKKATKKNSPKSKPKPDTTEIRGLLVLAAAIMIFLSLLSFAYGQESKNWLGLTGYTIGKILHALFGLGSYFLSLYLGWIGWRLLFKKALNHLFMKTVWVLTATASTCLLLSLIEEHFLWLSQAIGNFFYTNLWQRKLHYHLGGALFYYLYKDLPIFNLFRVFNALGVAIIFSSTFIASFMFLMKITPAQVAALLIRFFAKFKLPQREQLEDIRELAPAPEDALKPAERDATRFVKLRTPDSPVNQAGTSSLQNKKEEATNNSSQELLEINPQTDLKIRPSLSSKEKIDYPRNLAEEPPRPKAPLKKESKEACAPSAENKRDLALVAQSVYNGDFTHYALPSPALLTSPKKVDQSSLKQDLRRQAEVLEETLLSFGIEAKVGQINCGPTINSFEVHPAIGVKVQKIKTLENDIALNMEAKSIRIIAPIPGKAAVGIEVPNPQPQEVAFKDLLQAYQQGNRKFHIPILLGKAVNGDYVMSDLAKMPHCIIAGATGSGKSVCINTIVMSIVLNAKPDEVKLLMVDPKKVELTPYTNMPHMLAPVITEPQEACAALNWLVKEMENRYDILKLVGVRNIDSFNNRVINKELEESLDKEIPLKMHYIVGIIDELADLMMVSSSDIETPIARIAQMARAVGIHLILATQRPSREVITGLIKANFPTRISFKVASRVNSQIVLDESGAESLLGNGDMLFLPPGTSHLVRAQGAFVRDEDIYAVVKKINEQAPPNYVITSFNAYARSEESEKKNLAASSGDSLYDQALSIVKGTGNASTTFLQRKLKIGYARAASLMDELEAKGVVSPADGSKARKILTGRSAAQSQGEMDSMDCLDEEDSLQ